MLDLDEWDRAGAVEWAKKGDVKPLANLVRVALPGEAGKLAGDIIEGRWKKPRHQRSGREKYQPVTQEAHARQWKAVDMVVKRETVHGDSTEAAVAYTSAKLKRSRRWVYQAIENSQGYRDSLPHHCRNDRQRSATN